MNIGGWGESYVRLALNRVDGTSGAIYRKFSKEFRNAVKEVPKEYNIGGDENSQTATPSTADCKFWILSYTEPVKPNASDYFGCCPKYEGTQYDWCAENVTNAFFENTCLQITITRAGFAPGSCSNLDYNWWQRSPDVTDRERFGVVCQGRAGSATILANWRLGVVPFLASKLDIANSTR